MRIFQEVSAFDSDDALTAATGAVVERVVAVPGPRSLCEIQADAEDYQWLCNWIGQLSPHRLGRWLEGIGSRKIALQSCGLNLSYIAAAGCLLLLLASEAARRRASEGQVWSAVRSQFNERVGSVLFVQRQPRPIFKDAMETAARKLDLRHVFGIEGTQNYYLSVYLRSDSRRREWSVWRIGLRDNPLLRRLRTSWETKANGWLRSPLPSCGIPCETTVGTTSPKHELSRFWPTIPGHCQIGRMNCSGRRDGTKNLVHQTKAKRAVVNNFPRNFWRIRACSGIGLQRRRSQAVW